MELELTQQQGSCATMSTTNTYIGVSMRQKSNTSLRGAFGAISQMNAKDCDEDAGINQSFIS
jgi:hypothetical protein